MSLHLTIDPEFASIIPPLREEEQKQLEENILADGVVINPLIVWNGVIVDGHNRYRILQQHPELQFTTYEKAFSDRYEAIAWICKNQLGRRNLTLQQFKYLMGHQYKAEKTAYGGDRKNNAPKSSYQNGNLILKEKTCERIAAENGVARNTVIRAEQFANGVDAAEEAVPGIKQEILTGSIKPAEKAVAAIAKAPPEERPALVQQLRQTKEPEKPEEKPKPKRSAAETLQAIRDISDNMLQSNGEIDADDICAELEDALDTMIFRWDTCLENNREQRSACRDGISLPAKDEEDYMKISHTSAYQEMMINSKLLEVPRGTYQRELRVNRVRRIAAKFDPRLLNPPKVSYRNGHYYVFDGQHTVAVLKLLNGGKDLMIRCIVYTGMTESEEALLFAQQTGESAQLTPGDKMRAQIYGGDPECMAFLKATEAVGLRLDYTQRRGKHRIGCVGTAFEEFKRVGADLYKEALSLIVAAWHGDPESLRAETIQGVTRFIELYHDEYDPRRLVSRLHKTDPLTIYREGRAMGVNMAGHKKYLYQVFCIYNGSSKKKVLPMKF